MKAPVFAKRPCRIVFFTKTQPTKQQLDQAKISAVFFAADNLSFYLFTASFRRASQRFVYAYNAQVNN